jgi:hypothetical protein
VGLIECGPFWCYKEVGRNHHSQETIMTRSELEQIAQQLGINPEADDRDIDLADLIRDNPTLEPTTPIHAVAGHTC